MSHTTNAFHDLKSKWKYTSILPSCGISFASKPLHSTYSAGKGLHTTHSQPLAASIDRLPDDFYDDLQLWFAASLNRVDFNHCWMPIFLRIAQRKKKQKENQLRRNMYMWLFARLARQGTRMTRWVRYTESPCRTISELLLRCVTEIDNNRLWWCLCAGFWCVQ